MADGHVGEETVDGGFCSVECGVESGSGNGTEVVELVALAEGEHAPADMAGHVEVIGENA